MRAFRGSALALLLGAAPFGCLGGQTGQPTSAVGGDCGETVREVPPDRAVRGVIPLDAAQALEGSYTESFVWVDDTGAPLPDVPPDEISVTFTYDGGAARYDPCGRGGPDVEMVVDVALRDGGLSTSGTARVAFYPDPVGPSGDFAGFSLGTTELAISGVLTRTSAATSVSGKLLTADLPPPLREGRYPEP